MDIVFMGTPDFAVNCLVALHGAGHRILGVFTQPDRPKGRGYTLTPPPVKVRAQALGLPVYQPERVRDDAVLEALRTLAPELIVVVAYGKILPAAVLGLPKHGCVNIHASLLPKYRGASPIQSAILAGETHTGVTAMQMDEGMDTGDILLIKQLEIGACETADELFDRLSALGAAVLLQTVEALATGTVKRIPQDNGSATYAKMLDKSMSPIDFTRPACEVDWQIRGLSPWPCAKTVLHGKGLKVFRSTLCTGTPGRPGEVVDYAGRLLVACGDGGCVELLEVGPEGKKRMCTADFLRGNPVAPGTVLGE